MELAKTYTPADVEPHINQKWNDAKAWHAVPGEGKGDPYVIVIPPPNVTAALHMGHALNNTIQDVLIRYHRMLGDNTIWMPGTDHAGIATQTVVDKRLQAENQPALKDYKKLEAEGRNGREQFIEKVQTWKDEYEAVITNQLRSMGCSCDWDRQRFTMDEVCAAAVREAFFQLFKDGLIYRGKRLVNWDPVTQTALADDEVEMETVDGHFWYMKYPVVDEAGNETGEFCTVATTRPETMLGDTAVAVNPDDPERAKFIGKHVRLPIVNRIIPVIGDDYVVKPDPEASDEKAKFASGFLKVTPAHDPNDYEIGQRHDLPVINVMAPDASISREHGWPAEEFENKQVDAFCHDLLGMDRYEAREAIVTWFREQGLLADVKPYTHSVGHSYRSHVPVEPYLSDQWYVKVTDDRLAGAALRGMAEEQRSESDGPVWREENGSVHGGAGVPPADAPKEHPGITRGMNIHQRRLPHWQAGGRRYFITFRLAQGELAPQERQLVLDACLHWHGERADVQLVTVMPDHVHIIMCPLKQTEDTWHALPDLMHSIKSFTAHEINKLRGNSGQVWQDEYFDRMIRDREEYEEKWDYMQFNPVKAGLCKLPEEYAYTKRPEGSALRADGGRDARPTMEEPTSSNTGGAGFQPANAPQEHPPFTGQGDLRFHPPRYAKTFQTWHENIRDWCISRQLWWGHRIPVWHLRIEVTSGQRDYSTLSLGNLSYALSGSAPSTYGRAFNSNGDQLTKEQCTALCNAELDGEFDIFVCILNQDYIEYYEHRGFTQDPDVLDTWFSSALWPISTLGWPNPDAFAESTADGSPTTPEGDVLLKHWNPGSVLCTAREIITLWVSRMVMFNIYFRGCLPFKDVFIHAMIQDGEGQKMSKSLGNGVDPLDIIHSHGSDAMRFTLAQMTTQTQDVRMPVDAVCPHTGETFEPKMITNRAGFRVAAPIQESPKAKGKKMVTGYGVASGEAAPTDDMPQARNTSSKFDIGRNFANKLWNAVRFALTAMEEAKGGEPAEHAESLAGKWIQSRTVRVIEDIDKALGRYDFHAYANRLYQFVWNEVCDWYIESVKGVIRKPEGATARLVLSSVLDVTLRLLHPVMPFITEELWTALNSVAPKRGLRGIELPPSGLLMKANWPRVDHELIDEEIEATYERMQTLVTMIREARSSSNTPPRETVEVSIKCSDEVKTQVDMHRALIEALSNATLVATGPDTAKPANAAVVVRPIAEVYLHREIDAAAEKDRLNKQLDTVTKSIKALSGRLNNKGYVEKAPDHLVQETRDELARAEAEKAAIEQQLKDLGG